MTLSTMNVFIFCNLFLVLSVLLFAETGSAAAVKCGDCVYLQYVDPVCGSDGKSYSNIGALQCQSLCNSGPCRLGSISRKKRQLSRRCGGPCICTAEYAPVCGSNGKTFGNSCQLYCQARCTPGLRLVSRGECM